MVFKRVLQYIIKNVHASNYVHWFYGSSIWIWPCEVIASVAAVIVMVVKVHLWL